MIGSVMMLYSDWNGDGSSNAHANLVGKSYGNFKVFWVAGLFETTVGQKGERNKKRFLICFLNFFCIKTGMANTLFILPRNLLGHDLIT
jgi:hypothetical protein